MLANQIATPMKEKPRSSTRRRVFKTATLAFKGRSATIDCTICDLSEGGARLKVASAVGIPDSFELMLAGEPVRFCRVIWVKATQIGVAFV
jgi:PilZ domain